MFENKTEKEAREEILSLVKEYCSTYHNQKTPFKEGDRISYASRVYDHQEMVNLVDSSLEFWLTSGRYTDEFEKKAGTIFKSPVLFPCEFRFIGESDGIYGPHIAAFKGTPDKTR